LCALLGQVREAASSMRGADWLSAARFALASAWFPKNVARNSHVNLSNFELASLELQRLWG